MITKDDVYKLAGLARIELSETEAQRMTHEIDSILDYVSQVTETGGDVEQEKPVFYNVMRLDVVTNEPKQYTEKILNNAPSRKGDFVKVKKIL